MNRYVIQRAEISACTSYRYVLERSWSAGTRRVLFVGLNPSTADAVEDDPTIRRCVGFAKGFGFDGMLMANLFAARSTKPSTLADFKDPIGPENDGWISVLERHADLVIAAWGNGGKFMGRSQFVREMLDDARCFGKTAKGEPKHPLYLPANCGLKWL